MFPLSHVSKYFSDDEIRRICEEMPISIDKNPHLSERSKRIIKSVFLSDEDLKQILVELASEKAKE
ncbi:hypothetical protein D0T25_03595 [Duganella sp. BJB488]|uniref:hypothetical protein n=1 Tax=unclassified Duganella TaxID=2636909 RepID=UPI000E350BD2|nr:MULTISPECIES: hypothetical protein [unclassified Duganella]NVD72134.1 hypothetical protein [Duganella sp. BJB1802]RFP26490.1 hypothetical protein D0T25_03595 [Duganella sp. BJB488]